MNYMALLLFVTLIVLVPAVCWLALRIGPNPWLGFRVGYTLSSREVWDETHRYLLRVMPPFLLPLLVLGLFGSSGDAEVLLALSLMFALLVPPTVMTWRLAAELAERVGSDAGAGADGLVPMAPIRTHWFWVALPLLPWLALVALTAAYYGDLPAELATHFDASGEPDDWMARDYYAGYIIVLSSVFALAAPLLAWVGRRHPMILYRGELNLGRNDLLTFACMMLAAVEFILLAAHAETLYYALHEEHPGSLWWLWAVIAATIGPPMAWLIYRWRLARRGRLA